jgi:hypothetical protein
MVLLSPRTKKPDYSHSLYTAYVSLIPAATTAMRLRSEIQSSNSMQAYKEAEKVVKGLVDGSVGVPCCAYVAKARLMDLADFPRGNNT